MFSTFPPGAKMLLLIISLLPRIIVSAQWTKTSGPQGMSVNTLYKKGNLLFAGTSAKGVFRSADNGITWQASNTGIKNRNVFAITSDGNSLLAGTDKGVFGSVNNGTDWKALNTGIEQKFVQS